MFTRFPDQYNNLNQIRQFPQNDELSSFSPPTVTATSNKETAELEREGFARPVFLGEKGQRVLGDIDRRFVSRRDRAADTAGLTNKNKTLAEKFNRKAFSISSNLKGWSGAYKKIDAPIPTGTSNIPSPTTPSPSGAKNVVPSVKFQNLIKNLGVKTTKWGGTTRFEKFHPAIDIANKIGTPIPAFTGGVITSVVTGRKQGDKGYGNYVIVTDTNGNKHRYSHLHQANVQVGQKVLPGQKLGSMGNTGSTYSTSGGTGSHLDYRITDAYNKYVNPNQFFANF